MRQSTSTAEDESPPPPHDCCNVDDFHRPGPSVTWKSKPYNLCSSKETCENCKGVGQYGKDIIGTWCERQHVCAWSLSFSTNCDQVSRQVSISDRSRISR